MSVARRAALHVRNRPAVGSASALLALIALGVLVDRGALTGIDTYAVRNLMPYGSGMPHGGTSAFGRLIAYSGDGFHFGRALRVPASALGSAVGIVGICAVLWRRGAIESAVLWFGALVALTFAEGVGKIAVAKPQLYNIHDGVLTPIGFHHSFPSGHAARAALLAAALAATWRRLAPIAILWVVAVVVTAEMDAIHTPSDLLGGLLVAAWVILGVEAIGGGRRRDAPIRRSARLPASELGAPSRMPTRHGDTDTTEAIAAPGPTVT